MSIDVIVDGIIKREGGYVNNAADKGGPTCWGITEVVARKNGYKADMKDLPLQMARDIYLQQYYLQPRFNLIANVNSEIAEELTDTGVNMGPAVAITFLQRALNAFNKQGTLYPDIIVDGYVGAGSVDSLQKYIKTHDSNAIRVMKCAMNCLQGARYISLSEGRAKNEMFTYGWFAGRVAI